MPNWKKFFGALGQGALTGASIAAPIIAASAPKGSRAAVIAGAISHLTDRAESDFPAAGSGPQKAEFVTVEALQLAERVTGKNIDSPEGRKLLSQVSEADVLVKQATAFYGESVTALHAYIESVQEPAKDDTAAA